MLLAAFLVGLTAATSTTDCGSVRYHRQLMESEMLITHAVMWQPPVGELPTRNGTYQCVLFSFRVDASGRAADIKVEKDSTGGYMAFVAREPFKEFRFKQPAPLDKRLLIMFDGMVNRWPELPPGLE